MMIGILIFSLILSVVNGYSSGPPRCSVRIPGHNKPSKSLDLNNNPLPVDISVEYEGNDLFMINITGGFIKGYLIDTLTPGVWIDNNGDNDVSTSKDTCVHHNSNYGIRNPAKGGPMDLSFKFQAESEDSPTFRFIIVEKRVKFWHDIYAKPVDKNRNYAVTVEPK